MNTRIYIFLILLVSCAALSAGCKPAECRQMVRCCAQVEDIDGIGKSCGALAANVRDGATCTSIIETVGYMLEDKQQPVPAICKP
ncbi:MAG: hypothetical protein H0U74_16025 [Bradymonadaceae bacterium]|nr:hypothetical protein [Lujinxingiaceae bacterium]